MTQRTGRVHTMPTSGIRPADDFRPDSPGGDRPPSWLRRNGWWLIALGALAVSRTISVLVGIIAAHHAHLPLWYGPRYNSFGGGATHGAGGYFTSWDSYWYLSAAEHGWPHVLIPKQLNPTAFFPALPLALRAVHAVTGLSWVVTGLVVEAVLEIGAVTSVSLLARRVLGERRGNFAVVLFCLFPGAYVFSQVYSEPLFILAAAGCLYGLYRRWWWLAGLSAALAGATRPTGIVLIGCCAWVAAREIWLRRAWLSLVAPILSPIGTVAFLLFLRARTGTAQAYLLTQAHAFGQTGTVYAVPKEIEDLLQRQETAFVVLAFLLWGVIGLGLMAVAIHQRKMPSEWLVFCLGMIAVTLVSKLVGFRPRMALVAFPLIFAYADVFKRWRTVIPAVGLCGAGLAALAYSIPYYVP